MSEIYYTSHYLRTTVHSIITKCLSRESAFADRSKSHRVTSFIMSTFNPLQWDYVLSVAAYVMLFSSFLFSHTGKPQIVPETQRLLFLFVARAHHTEQPGTAGLCQTGQRENKTVDKTHSSGIVVP